MRIASGRDLEQVKETGLRSLYPDRPKLSISVSTCGLALGAERLLRHAAEKKEKHRLDITLSRTGCSGFCSLEPLAVLSLPEMAPLIYVQTTPERIDGILNSVKQNRAPHEGPLCRWEHPAEKAGDPEKAGPGDAAPCRETPPFKGQTRSILDPCGLIDPLSVPEYVAVGGCHALFKALHHMSPETVLEEVKRSGLRGRGGAWFSTGLKWQMAREASGEEKFIICNADEGDPGAYKDRTIMEANPFKLFEGLALAGYAIGAHQGIIYLREEYPHTHEFLDRAIQAAREYALLGRGVLGSEFNFTLRVVRGGGSYVCGEETALMDSLEGEVGDPRLRPPFPIERGLWEQPTVVNNVETLSNIPAIIDHGADWYAGIGTENAKGTKIFSVVGKIKQPGLYEVPLGTPLDHVIFELAGGPEAGSEVKAVQVGSPFGNFIPADRLGISLDPETLTGMGSMIGSGVILVLNQDSCLVDTLMHLLSFFVDESCGKCTPCREGVFQMKEVMTRISEGRSTPGDLELLSELGQTARDFALCGLGGGAAGPVLNGITDFRSDFEAHVKTGKCPWSVQSRG